MTLRRSLRELALRLRAAQANTLVQLCQTDLEKSQRALERALQVQRETRAELMLFLTMHGQP